MKKTLVALAFFVIGAVSFAAAGDVLVQRERTNELRLAVASRIAQAVLAEGLCPAGTRLKDIRVISLSVRGDDISLRCIAALPHTLQQLRTLVGGYTIDGVDE